MPLPVPQDCMRVRFRAELMDGAVASDEAQFGFWGIREHVTGNTVNWPSDVATVAEKIRDKWNQHITGKGRWSSAVVMRTVTVDHLEAATGKVLDQGVAVFEGDDAWAGSTTASLPWETACAVSLYGYTPGAFAQDKGRKRGRFYLPPFGANMLQDGTGQLAQADVTNLLNEVRGFLNDVQGLEISGGGVSDPDYFDLRVVSRGTPSRPLPPTSTPVTIVRIDSKIDSQRRREAQQTIKGVAQGSIDHS